MAFFVTCLILLTFSIGIVQGRILSLNTNPISDLISDGVDYHVQNQSVLVAPNAALTAQSVCIHQYGFLPCVENVWGYVFMILVYQGLLVRGEMLIGSGYGVLANIVGTVKNQNGAKVGGVILDILMSLPPMIFMIVSGVFSSKEGAQSMVSVGVGIYAGITVFSLTVQWAVCVMYGKKGLLENGACNSTEKPDENCFRFSLKKAIDLVKDNAAVTIDEKTQYTAGIMLLSLIPYMIVQLDSILASINQTVTLVALIVSLLSLIAYFTYQIIDPWSIQKRHLKYMNYELRTEFLQHLRRHGEFVDCTGKPNIDVIKRLYADVDVNGDNYVTEAEVKGLVQDILTTGKIKVSERFAVEEIMKTFKFDGDKINEEEFIEGCKRWIGESNQLPENSDESSNIVHEILDLFKEDKLKDEQERARIMAKILKHAEKNILVTELLVTPEGEPNVEHIRNLFTKFDSNGDKAISTSELHQLLKKVNFGETKVKYEDVVKDLFKDFDKDNNNAIDESEFIDGIKKWVHRAIDAAKTQDRANCIENYHDIVWQHRVYGKWDLVMAVLKVIAGIGIMTVLGGPYIVSILQLSYAMSIPSFCISFVIVPGFTCGIATIRAIQPTQGKASLTFSEIYGRVIMNNVSGMTTLLTIVYAKGLAFDFSAEVLTILVVCAVIGALAFSRKTYPGWTSILAILLYPFSLVMFWLVQFEWSWN